MKELSPSINAESSGVLTDFQSLGNGSDGSVHAGKDLSIVIR